MGGYSVGKGVGVKVYYCRPVTLFHGIFGILHFPVGVFAYLTLFAAKAAPTILPFTVGAALAANLPTWQPGESVNYFNIYMKDAGTKAVFKLTLVLERE